MKRPDSRQIKRLTTIGVSHDEIQAHKLLELLPEVRLELLSPAELPPLRAPLPLPLQLVVFVFLVPFGGTSSPTDELNSSETSIEMTSSSGFVVVGEAWPGVFFELKEGGKEDEQGAKGMSEKAKSEKVERGSVPIPWHPCIRA